VIDSSKKFINEDDMKVSLWSESVCESRMTDGREISLMISHSLRYRRTRCAICLNTVFSAMRWLALRAAFLAMMLRKSREWRQQRR